MPGPQDLRGLGLTNWYTANAANKVIILHHMLNDEPEGDIHRMALTEIWVVSQQTGDTGTMATPPCDPSDTPGWGWTAVPCSCATQTWI